MKHLIIIVLIVLLTSTICYSGEIQDAWDSSYILGTAFLNTSLMFGFEKSFVESSLITIGCSIVKETLDMLYTKGYIKRSKFNDRWLDQCYGFDPKDIGRCGPGIGLSSISYFINKYTKKKFKIYMNQSKLTFQFKF